MSVQNVFANSDSFVSLLYGSIGNARPCLLLTVMLRGGRRDVLCCAVSSLMVS